MAMVKYIGVRFKKVGKISYFAPGELDIHCGDKVIVETVRGVECGEVVLADREMEESKLNSPLKTVIRLATKKDFEMIEKNKKKEKALREKISKMKVGDKAVSIGGIVGKISKIKDDFVILETGNIGTQDQKSYIKLEKSAIRDVQTKIEA